jgi:hypothetical protein
MFVVTEIKILISPSPFRALGGCGHDLEKIRLVSPVEITIENQEII